jgi:DNA-binding PadR family transcriptional regulator
MITTKILTNDLIALERQGLIKKAGYQYNPAGDPEQRYELTQAGEEKFWAYELEHLSDADRVTLEGSGYAVTAKGSKALYRGRPPAVKTREVLERAQQAMRVRQQKELNRQRRVLLNFLTRMQRCE